MGAPAMLIAVPKNLLISDADLEDPLSWAKALIHAAMQF